MEKRLGNTTRETTTLPSIQPPSSQPQTPPHHPPIPKPPLYLNNHTPPGHIIHIQIPYNSKQPTYLQSFPHHPPYQSILNQRLLVVDPFPFNL